MSLDPVGTGNSATVPSGALTTGTLPVASGALTLTDSRISEIANGEQVLGNLNDYFEVNAKNSSAGSTASSDLVATANTGTATTNFIDVGINGSGYSAGVMGGPLEGYVYTSDENLSIGAIAASKVVRIVAGGASVSSNTVTTFSSTGQVTTGVVTAQAAATQDAVRLQGRAGGTSSFTATITPTTLTANRTVTLPDANVTIPSGTILTGTLANANRLDSTSAAGVVKESQIADGVTGGVLSLSGTLTANRIVTYQDAAGTVPLLEQGQTFSGTQVFQNGNGIRVRAASTRDELSLKGLNVGSSSRVLTIFAPAVALSADQTQSLQDATGTIPLLEINPVQSFQNKIINGRFDFWQRGTSVGPISGIFYGPDRWLCYINGTGTATVSRQSVTLGTLTGEPTYACRFAVTALGTSTSIELDQRIESVRTLAGSNVQITFDARADSARNLFVDVVQFFGSGGGSAQVNTSGTTQSITTSFGKKTLTISIPNISGKTIGTAGDDYVAIILSAPSATGLWFEVTNVEYKQVAASAQVNTPMEIRPLQVELALCQRYYEIGSTFPIGYIGGAMNFGTWVTFKTAKRSVPTLVLTNTGVVNCSTSTNADAGTGTGLDGFTSYRAGTAAGAVQYTENWSASSEL